MISSKLALSMRETEAPDGVSSTVAVRQATSMPLPQRGDLIAGKYLVEEVLGRGGMGIVLSARHLDLDKRVAVKLLVDSRVPGASTRFLREARAAAKLESEHVVRVLDVGTREGGAPYLVMERLVGEDLAEVVRQRGALAVGTAVAYVLQACEALAEAHAHGIVHRDLKPSNLFLARKADGTSMVKLLDFGVAMLPQPDTTTHEGRLTAAECTLGSAFYMSPEQISDPRMVDVRTDVWALGVVLFELLTGRLPFEANSAFELGAAIISRAATPLRSHFAAAPVALEQVILRCLEKEPSRRYATVGALAAALTPFAQMSARGSSERERLERIERISLVNSERTVAAPPSSERELPPPSRVPESAPAEASSRVRIAAAPSSQSDGGRVTDRFRKQHEELFKLGLELGQQLSVKNVQANPAEVRRAVARFAGKLMVHAAMENEALYPRLLQHADPGVRAKAKDLFDEVEGLYARFGEFTKRWPTSTTIEADPVGFSRGARDVLKTLGMRMMREDGELYPLVDEVESQRR